MTNRNSNLDRVIYDPSILDTSDEQLGARQGFEAGTIDPKKATMALDMLKRGMDVDTISAITDLTTEQINQLSQTAKPISTWSQEKRDNEILTDSYIRDENPNEIFTTPFNIPDSEDNVMPSFEGLEDPKVLEDYQQMELADGGVVEREGFKDGKRGDPNKNPLGKNQYKTKTLEEIQKIIEANPDLTAKDLEGYGKKTKGRLLTREDLKKAKEANIEPGKKGKSIDPEKQRFRDIKRKELTKDRSNPAMEKKLRGTKEKNLSHAGRKKTPASLENLMYTDASANRKMLYPFEQPLEEAMTKFEEIYNSEASPEVKRKAAIDLQKFDRTLRQKYPEYAKLKTRFQFKNSAFEPGFIFKERLPDPSLAISSEAGTSLQGVNPKSKKGQALIKIAEKKLETLINNIGLEKIKAGKLNNNEFNILQKALKSSSAQTAIKYGGKALKGLGVLLVPIIAYDTYDQYKKGKPLAEIIEYGLIGTSGSREIRKIANYTPEEREAVQQAQQYERNQQDISGLSSDFDTPTNLSADEISELATTGSKRVDDLMLAQDEAKAKQRVYAGAPEILDYGQDIEVDD